MLVNLLWFSAILFEIFYLSNFISKFSWSDWRKTKRKYIGVRCWVHYVALVFDLTDDIDFEFFTVKVWIGLIQGLGGQMESSIHNHDLELCVTMVG